MSQPKRRTALLLTGTASALLAAVGLAPRPAHAQFAGGMAMPQAMLPPGHESGAPMGGMLPNRGTQTNGGMYPGQASAPSRSLGVWPSAAGGSGPVSPGGNPYFGRAYNPYFGPNYGATTAPTYVPSFPGSFHAHENAPVSSATPGLPAAPGMRPFGRHSHGGGGFNGSGGSASLQATVPPGGSTSQRISIGSVSPPVPGNPGINAYLYAPQAPVVSSGGPSLLGGFYYGNYCDTVYGTSTYPAVYSVYIGFPPYIFSPGVVYQTLTSYQPVYLTEPQPFTPPQYQVTYNQTNYYVVSEDKAAQIEGGGAPAKQAVHQAYPADSYQAAFADIERAWTDGNLDLLKNHLRSNDTKVSVFLHSKYKYSLNSSDFSQITRDAFDRLDTISFQFTRLRKAKNGDVTAYGKHVYRAAETSKSAQGTAATSDNTVPFDENENAPSADSGIDGLGKTSMTGEEKTVYVSYTLRHGDSGWYITGVNSSTDPLVKEAQ